MLLKKDLKPVYLFKEKEVDSGYVGTKTVYAPSHIVYGNIQTASNKITLEVYGERAYNMVSIMCDRDTDVSADYRISLDGYSKPTHRVLSIIPYSTHKKILAEVIGVGV